MTFHSSYFFFFYWETFCFWVLVHDHQRCVPWRWSPETSGLVFVFPSYSSQCLAWWFRAHSLCLGSVPVRRSFFAHHTDLTKHIHTLGVTIAPQNRQPWGSDRRTMVFPRRKETSRSNFLLHNPVEPSHQPPDFVGLDYIPTDLGKTRPPGQSTLSLGSQSLSFQAWSVWFARHACKLRAN